ncbi:hypothetical protein GBN26_03570 [Plesiomonas shigelloides]|uniref:hypothetical protein n=1 Tax=Plesiomonas shigelloides TaxID=703 RepID=UPI0012629A96|nr:hypothetical protein [Plesiomonas shigelloides]KAB7702246.1 hypothetical protein GBN26_03570 [Plesiomonas shigelloides]
MKPYQNGFATLTVVLIIMLLAAMAVLTAGHQTYQRVKSEQESVIALEAYNNAQSGLTCARMWLAGKKPADLQAAINPISCSEPLVDVSVTKYGASSNFVVNSTGRGSDVSSSIRYIIKHNIMKLQGFVETPDSAFISKGAVVLGGTVMITGGVNSIVSGGNITITGSDATEPNSKKPQADHLKETLPSDYYLGDGFTSSNTVFKKMTCDDFSKLPAPSKYLNENKNVWLIMDEPVCKLPTTISAGIANQVKPITFVIENLSGSTSPTLALGDLGGSLTLAGMFVFIDKNGPSSTLGLKGSFNITGALITDSGFSTTTGSLTMLYDKALLDAIDNNLSTLGFTRGTWRDY